METVGKQVQVVSGLGVGGPVGPVGPVGADLHHHHHPHPHGGHGHGHSLVGSAATSVARGQAQSHQSQAPPPSHNQHLPARSTPVQLHRPTQNYINIKSSSPASPRTVGSGTYVQGANAGPSSGPGVSSSGGTGSVVAVTGSIASTGVAGGAAAVAVSAVAATTGGGFVAVPVPTGLRYVHPYLPPPLPAPSAPVNQTPPPQGAAAAYTRDVYRNTNSNVNDRVAISVSSSPVSQVGVSLGCGVGAAGEYVVTTRGERPRISMLSTPAAAASTASSTAPEYPVAAARNPRGMIPMQSEQYCNRGNSMEMATMSDAPPFKKIRLGQPSQSQSQPQSQCQNLLPSDTIIKQDHVQQLQQPLRIDTREQPVQGAYTPQTEAISPTPEPNTQEDAQFRTTKDELLQQIGKVDREIAKRETQISKLRKKLKELEEAANKPLEASGLKRPVEEQSQQPKHQSPAQKIYADNRKKAEEAHRVLDRLGPKVDLPLYNQPSDTIVYQENRERHHASVRPKLILRLRREHSERATLHRKQSQTYAVLVQDWHRKVERAESTQKRKTKEAKNRDFFEKVFPELRKQREDKERFNRVGARIKSEADLEEIMDGLQEQEMEDKKMRSYAVIPPLLLDLKQRRIAFQNRNGLLQSEELEALHSERKLINVWSSMEHELFKEKYLSHPKNFGAIAQSFEHKFVPDCVHHYYLTKKAENYKQLLRKSRRTRSSRNNPNNKVNNSNSTIGPIDILSTGVTTRLQREQQQKTQENPQNNLSTATATTTVTTTTAASATVSGTTTTSASSTTTSSVTTPTTTSSSTSSVTTTASSLTESTTSTSTATTTTSTFPSTTSTTSSVVTLTSAASAKDAREANKENKENKDNKEAASVKTENKEEPQSSIETSSTRAEGKSALSMSTNTTSSSSTTLSTTDCKEKKKSGSATGTGASSGRTKDKKKDNHAVTVETSDEEAQPMDTLEGGTRQLGIHTCAVCQSTVEGGNQSRPLSRSQASQYGLKEDQVSPGARVCNTCRCKAVRGRYITCPLPGCPNLNNANTKNRVKRLRALPAKWLDLPPEIRDPVVKEFQIPNNATKCCSTCFNRISRRLAPHLSGGPDASEEGGDSAIGQWSEDELEQLRRALREHGTNWPKVSEQIPEKTNHQCKSYYFTYRKKHGLDQVVAEYYQSLGEERRPCLTDEEESGSSTSSCDEIAVHDSSDTASAGSPANTISSTTAIATASSSTSTALTVSFSQTSDQKVGDKVSDISVVSLGSSLTSSQSLPSNAPLPSSNREDYDSSATETADEGQGGADLDNSVVLAVTTSSTSNSSGPQHQQSQQQTQQQQRQSQQSQQQPPPSHSPSTTSNANPLTVKDLMLGVIEMQLKRNPNSPANTGSSSVPISSSTPTISSILNTDHRNDITFVREYKHSASISQAATPNRESNLATLSVVSSPHHGHRSVPSPQQIGQMQATITPCPPSVPSSQAQPSDLLPKEGLVVLQVQQVQKTLRDTEGTLDLSIKKPRQQQEYNHSLQPPHKPPSVGPLYRPEPPPGAYYHSHPHSEQGRGAKSPLVYVSSPRPQAPLTPKMNKVAAPPHPKLSPKLSNIGTAHKGGSITHGTPVSGARYEGLLRQMTPPGNVNASNTMSQGPKETGSITQGTPVHPFAVDKRGPMYDYHRSIRHSPVSTGNVPGQGQNPGVVVTHSNQYNSYPARPPPSYTTEQQLSSRQIIINDYITSQQMHARGRGTSTAEPPVKNEPPSTLYYAGTPPPQTHTQPRQGVIQRHNTQKPIHYPPPPGLEAFSSLVDVAVQQPSLPVPHPHGHPATSSSGHEGLGKTMADRLMADRYVDNNRAFREQEMRMQEHRLAMQQQVEHRMAVAHHQQQRDRERERERDLAHLREKEEQRLQREKEIQLEHRMAVQQQQHHQREKEMQQEHRLAHQREKEMQHVEHRLSVQQREKEIQHSDHRLAVHQQREKEIQQQMAVAAQREKEHQEHRLAVQQREKEMQQQQEHRLAVQHQREKEMQQQQAEHRIAVQQQRERELAHLHQQQQLQHHMQHQQRIEAERRHIVQIYRDQHQHLEREPSRVMGSGFPPQSSRHQQPQQQSQQPSSRQSQPSVNQQSSDGSSTLTAASLIDAIITHQINQSTDAAGTPSSNNQQRPGDRLFQGFQRDSPAEPNGVAHSPAGENNPVNSGSGGGSGGGSGNKGVTLGEHIEHIVTKDYGPPFSSYRPYSGYQPPDDQWKKRKGLESDSVKSEDERQIIRVAQQQQSQQQQQQQQQQSQQSSQSAQSVGKQFHSVEPVSPPEATSNHYARRFYETTTATTTSGTPSNKHSLSPLDYVKNKIVEVMRTSEDDKGTAAERNGGGGGPEKDDKPGVESPAGGEIVIDESPNPPPNQPPVPTPTTFYPFSALGVHTGPPPAPPSSATASLPKPEQMQPEPAPLLSAQYEPLSDED